MRNGARWDRLRLLVGPLVLVSCGCQVAPSEAPAAVASESVEAPTAEYAASATYIGIYEEPITLTAGRYEGEPFVPDGASRPTVGLLDELQMVADLDGDGADERIVLLWENSGGSGTNVYVASLRAGAEGVATWVGNRVEIRTLKRHGNLLQMETLRAGAEDAMCCPGELATLRWQGTAAGLELVSDEISGRFDLATVAGEWRLATEEALHEALIAAGTVEGSPETGDQRVVVRGGAADAIAALQEADITLAIGADGSVSGRSGCNRYSGTARFSAPNGVGIGPLMMTEMACPPPMMAVEQAFTSRLLATTRVGFHLGKLALGWQTEESGSGTLLFVPR